MNTLTASASMLPMLLDWKSFSSLACRLLVLEQVLYKKICCSLLAADTKAGWVCCTRMNVDSAADRLAFAAVAEERFAPGQS